MDFGVAYFPTDYAIPPAELGPALEKRGFESLWVAEHSHIPVDRQSPWPGGDELPKMYHDAADPFVALSMAAATTTTLKLATGICLVVQRDPIQTAKQVASLDLYSGGRFLFGVGGGWNAEEMENHGTPFDRRWKILRERIEAMKTIWTESKPEYHGEFVDFDPIYAWPKPAQDPHPPIHVGGIFPGGARRALRYGNGWVPIAARGDVLDELARLPELAEEEGRDPAEIEISMYYGATDEGEIDRYREAGVHRVIFGLPPVPTDEMLPLLDSHAQTAGLA